MIATSLALSRIVMTSSTDNPSAWITVLSFFVMMTFRLVLARNQATITTAKAPQGVTSFTAEKTSMIHPAAIGPSANWMRRLYSMPLAESTSVNEAALSLNT